MFALSYGFAQTNALSQTSVGEGLAPPALCSHNHLAEKKRTGSLYLGRGRLLRRSEKTLIYNGQSRTPVPTMNEGNSVLSHIICSCRLFSRGVEDVAPYGLIRECGSPPSHLFSPFVSYGRFVNRPYGTEQNIICRGRRPRRPASLSALSFGFALTNGLPLNPVGTGVLDCPFRYESKFFPRRTVRQLVARTPCPYNKWGIWCAAILFVLAVCLQNGRRNASPTNEISFNAVTLFAFTKSLPQWGKVAAEG